MPPALSYSALLSGPDYFLFESPYLFPSCLPPSLSSQVPSLWGDVCVWAGGLLDTHLARRQVGNLIPSCQWLPLTLYPQAPWYFPSTRLRAPILPGRSLGLAPSLASAPFSISCLLVTSAVPAPCPCRVCQSLPSLLPAGPVGPCPWRPRLPAQPQPLLAGSLWKPGPPTGTAPGQLCPKSVASPSSPPR